MKMNYNQEFSNFFETIAKRFFNHSDSEKHYCGNGLDEFLEKNVSSLVSDVLIYDNNKFRYIDKEDGSILKERKVFFWVVRSMPDTGDYGRINQTMDELETLGDQVLDYIESYRLQIISQPNNKQFKLSIFKDFKYEKVDIDEVINFENDHWYGYFYTVSLIHQHRKQKYTIEFP